MRRILLWSVLGLLVLFASLVALVSVQVADVERLPPPDPALAIELGDGSHLPLGEVLERARQGLSLPIKPRAVLPIDAGQPVAEARVVGAVDVGNVADVERLALELAQHNDFVDPDPVFALGRQALADGRSEEALALFLSIPPESDRYSRARRIVAWNILTEKLDRPEQAVRYANESLHADPFSGNAWQDWCRVYGRTLGLPVD